MADPFQPKFVDLVRNYTTTIGTGNFVLGPAVNGYTSFTAACQVGDSFYYAALGVDKPAEREVGRGTLLAGGAISRTPINGTKTNFSSGTKSLALIAAAEWFSSVGSLAAAASAFGESLLGTTEAGDARQLLALGGASLLDGDPDATLAGDSDNCVATQKATKTYVDGKVNFSAAADRSGLAAATAKAAGDTRYLVESGREGVFVWSASDLSALVSVDSTQAIYVPPAADPTGASGAWVRKFSGAHNVRWFGATGDGVTNDGPAFVAALNYLAATAQTAGLTYSTGASSLVVPKGYYYLGATTLEICTTVHISGEGEGYAGGSASYLQWDANTTGIIVQTGGGTGGNGKSGTKKSGAASVIERLYLKGGYVNGAEGEYHGIQLRATATVRDCFISSFAGDGVHACADHTSADGAEPPYGNCNGFELTRLFINYCRDGVQITGGDANAGITNTVVLQSCRRHGLWDNSFLGNTHIAPQTAGASITGANDGVTVAASRVTYGGFRYWVIPGQTAGASTNAPSGAATDNTWWNYDSSGGVTTGCPAWVSGMLVREGYPFYSTNSNAHCTFIGGYVEGSQAPCAFSKRSISVGGMNTTGSFGTYQNVLQGSDVGLLSNAPIISQAYDGNYVDFTAQLGEYNLRTAIFWAGWRIKDLNSGGDWRIDYGNSSVDPPMYVTGSTTLQQFGTGASYPYAVSFRNLMVAANDKSTANARRFMIDSVAPTTGTHAVGEWVLYRGTIAGLIGWKCTGAGTPGTWEAVYSGYGASAVGYATGAGGTVAQATSKSTAVTLNKLCGQITTNAAALPANAAVSFTLTNSLIAADDDVRVWVKSGNATAATYRAWSEGNGAGNRTIVLQNISGGSLAESIVLGFAVVRAAVA